MEREREEREESGGRKVRLQNSNFAGGEDPHWYTVTRNNRGKRKYISDQELPSPSRSYAEVTRGVNKLHNTKTTQRYHSEQPYHQISYPPTVFILNIPSGASTKVIWNFLGNKDLIKDIILPRKRDINGIRHGFIHTYDIHFARYLVAHFNGSQLMNNKLILKFNHPRTPSQFHKVPTTLPPPPSLRDTNQPTKMSPQNMVVQPTHGTVKLDLNPNTALELNRSIIGLTNEDNWADALQEKILLKTQIPTKITGIAQKKFLITFMSEEDKQVYSPLLDEWFIETKQVNQLDLIPPRLAWIYCDGLPFSMWNIENWNKILGDRGTVVNKNLTQTECGMLQNSRICVETYQVKDINETLKVTIGDMGFWIKIKESSICYEIGTVQVQAISHKKKDNDINNNDTNSEVQSWEETYHDQCTVHDETQTGASPELDAHIIPEERTNVISTFGSTQETKRTNRTHDSDSNVSPLWKMRKENDSSSDSNNQESAHGEKQQQDLEAIEEIDEEDWSSENEYAQKIEKINMGKRAGRPRKHPRVNHFFDFTCKKTRKGPKK